MNQIFGIGEINLNVAKIGGAMMGVSPQTDPRKFKLFNLLS